jgi:serine/threonine protein kinase
MSAPDVGDWPSLSPEQHQRIGRFCEGLEAAWKSFRDGKGPPPRIQDHLQSLAGENLSPEERSWLLYYLVRIDVDYRRQCGLAVPRDEYQAAGPASVIERALRAASRTEAETIVGAPTTSSPLVPGLPLGNYQLVEKIGTGGQGEVWRALQLSPRREVALKFVLPSDPREGRERLERFRKEVEALARLSHKHIVHIYEFCETSNPPFFAMEFVHGGSLQRLIETKPLGHRQAAEMVEVLARTMDTVHNLDIIHRDLKPANVLLMKDGTPKLTDFGLVKQLKKAPQHSGGDTQMGTVMGTPQYMAPEQAQGRVDQVGRPADMYALGAILYRMLTGHVPMTADSNLSGSPTGPIRPRLLARYVPGDLEAICLKCLATDPGARYDSALALAGDLRRFLNAEPVTARPLGPLSRLGKWCLRERGAAAALAIFLVATVLTLLLSLYLLRALAQSEANLGKASEFAFMRGVDYCERGDVRRGLSWMAISLQIAPAQAKKARAEQRAQINQWLGRLHELKDSRVLHGGAGINAFAVSPDGHAVLTVASDGMARLWDVTGYQWQELRRYFGHRGPIRTAAISPDNRYVLTGGDDNQAILWEFATARPAWKLPRHRGGVRAVAFSRDGKLAATAGGDGEVQIWNLDGRRPEREPFNRDRAVTALAFSPHGKRLLAASDVGDAYVWELKGNAEPIALAHNSRAVLDVDFRHEGEDDPEDRYAQSASDDGKVRFWDLLDTKQEVFSWSVESAGSVMAVTFSPDGQSLLVGYDDGTARLAHLNKERKREFVGSILQQRSKVTALEFCLDGKALVTASDDGCARLWSTAAPPSALPEGLAQIVAHIEACTCMRIDDRGEVHELDDETLRKLKRKRAGD